MVGVRDGIPVDAFRLGRGSRETGQARPAAGPFEAQPLLARAFFLRFASFRFRFTEGFS
jgi:hypothetical protein